MAATAGNKSRFSVNPRLSTSFLAPAGLGWAVLMCNVATSPIPLGTNSFQIFYSFDNYSFKSELYLVQSKVMETHGRLWLSFGSFPVCGHLPSPHPDTGHTLASGTLLARFL
ncbi:hypothetical protein J6590_001631 [Homalodisca vitripennis]|nr:hypothetical protein J6590_001631 [Homalodisca vitripennis]